jgi:hypothetical protein
MTEESRQNKIKEVKAHLRDDSHNVESDESEVEKITIFNALTECEEYVLIHPDGTQDLDGERPSYADLIDPPEVCK